MANINFSCADNHIILLENPFTNFKRKFDGADPIKIPDKLVHGSKAKKHKSNFLKRVIQK